MVKNTKCIGKVAAFLKGKLSERDIEKVIEAIEDRVLLASKDQEGFVNFDDLVEKEALSLAEGMLRQNQLEKRTTLLNLKAKKLRRSNIDSFVDQGLTPDKAIQAVNVGVASHVPGTRLSVDARQKGLGREYQGGLINDLERDGLLPLYNSDRMEREIGRELWELSAEGGKPGSTGSKEAGRMAEIIHKWQRTSVKKLNDMGADIGNLQGYISRQTHNRTMMRKMGKQEWIKTILPRLDRAKSLNGEDPKIFLSKVYDELSTGEHITKVKPESDRVAGFKGMGNIAKKVSHSRVLHFKSAEDWMDYNQLSGSKGLRESIMEGLELSAHRTELMRTYGVNPRAAFDADMQHYRNKFKGDLSKFERLEGGRRTALDNQFKEIDGSTRIVEDMSLAQVGSILRVWQNTTKLGFATLSSFSDLFVKAAEVRYQGHGYLKGYSNAIESVFKGRGPKETREIGELIGVGFDGMIGSIGKRVSATDTAYGKVAEFQRLFFKANLLTWWTDTQKQGMGMLMSNHLAQKSSGSYADLGEDLQRVLGLYSIGDAEWGVIRKGAAKQTDGRSYLTPDAIQDVDDALVRKYLGDSQATDKQIKTAKDELQNRLQSYFIDRVEVATITPGAREDAIMHLGMQPGTALGEAVRLVMQFKSFPISMMTKVVGRDLYGKGRADIPALVHLAVMSTVFGYMAMTAKDLAKGTTPRPLDDESTWRAAFIQGGGSGILGDFLLGEYNRYGGGFWDKWLGPTASQVGDLASLASDAAEGKDLRAKLLSTVKRSLPGSNLFYTQSVLNYLFIYQLQEQLNPGYLRRMEKRKKKEQGNEFLFPPSRYTGR